MVTAITVRTSRPPLRAQGRAGGGVLRRVSGSSCARSQARRSARCRPMPTRCRTALIGVLLAVVFTGAMATYQLGIFAIFGGFMIGVILLDERGVRRRVEGARRHVRRSSSSCRSSSRSPACGPTSAASSTGADWGWCLLLDRARDGRQIRRLLLRRALRRPAACRERHARHHDEHARADGTDRAERRPRPRRRSRRGCSRCWC